MLSQAKCGAPEPKGAAGWQNAGDSLHCGVWSSTSAKHHQSKQHLINAGLWKGCALPARLRESRLAVTQRGRNIPATSEKCHFPALYFLTRLDCCTFPSSVIAKCWTSIIDSNVYVLYNSAEVLVSLTIFFSFGGLQLNITRPYLTQSNIIFF